MCVHISVGRFTIHGGAVVMMNEYIEEWNAAIS